MSQTIVYEQPLNETIRACLRLEQLFLEIDHQMTDPSVLGARKIISLIINVLHLLDRPDLKAKLARELAHHLSNLQRYGSSPNLDANKFKLLTQQLEELSHNLIDRSGKIGHRLRDIELLNTLRMHLASPGGGCSFDIPLYHYWLQQAPDIRQATLRDWLSDFEQIRAATALILDLVRQHTKIEEKTAIHGFHQELLDPQSNLRMICISLEKHLATWPEISVGRHFLSVRFFTPCIEKRPSQFVDNLIFSIAYCHA
ncbi:MAG: hypothetical protein A3E85_02515 [Gammaproteobacteria bacterium RIFCSPHIGHO2_12_FULL_45_12]|nr:MAG: hypothetical protein A3E85_02515 [Gammaproteobacteria bacterium RIFCSPHIGHO2_12_FULL_45_12]